MAAIDAWAYGDFSDGTRCASQRGGVGSPVAHAQVEQASAAWVKTTTGVVEATHQVTHVPGCVGDLPGDSLPIDQALAHAMPDGRTERDARSASWPEEQFTQAGLPPQGEQAYVPWPTALRYEFTPAWLPTTHRMHSALRLHVGAVTLQP